MASPNIQEITDQTNAVLTAVTEALPPNASAAELREALTLAISRHPVVSQFAFLVDDPRSESGFTVQLRFYVTRPEYLN